MDDRDIDDLSREVGRRLARRIAAYVAGVLGVAVVIVALLPPYGTWLASWIGNDWRFPVQFVTLAAGVGLLQGAAKLFDPSYNG